MGYERFLNDISVSASLYSEDKRINRVIYRTVKKVSLT